jgi:DNA polymerase III epsilon subunit-like protein
VARLAGGDDPAPRRAELQAMFDRLPWEDNATLVAHNAQFECEVLLNHGVALDIECTQLMAKALLAVAYDREEHKQAPPVRFGLADLVEREFSRTRDKSIRDRDWRDAAALDEVAVAYCRDDARDALELYRSYKARLEADGLLDGYRLIRQAILPTAAVNLDGMEFDAAAHTALIAHLRSRAARLKRLLDQICAGAVRNHGSTLQVGNWIMEQVLAGRLLRRRFQSSRPLQRSTLRGGRCHLEAHQVRTFEDRQGRQGAPSQGAATALSGDRTLPASTRALDRCKEAGG